MIQRWYVFFFCILLSGCGGSFESISQLTSKNQSSEEGSGDGGGSGTDGEIVVPPGPNFKPSICSDLSFEQVEWPSNVSTKQLDAFALGMNITGSFEGHDGWSNIANDFDGQGLSLGLFNQNFDMIKNEKELN